MTPHRLTLAGLAVLALAAAGCGSSNDSSSSSESASSSAKPTGGYGYGGGGTASASTSASAAKSGQVVRVSADPSGALKFNKKTLRAKAGRVTIRMTNPSGVAHSIAVEGHGVDKDATSSVTNGKTASVSAKLKRGRYEFYCPVDGHKGAGMKGTLIVR